MASLSAVEPDVGDDPFELTVVAHREHLPTSGQLKAVFEASDVVRIVDGAGLDYMNRELGGWPPDSLPGFRVDSVDPAAPFVVAYVPEGSDGAADDPAFEVLEFDDDDDEYNQDLDPSNSFSVSGMIIRVRAESDVVNRAAVIIGGLLDELGLYMLVGEEYLPAGKATISYAWDQFSKHREDREAVDARDGSVAELRTAGVRQTRWSVESRIDPFNGIDVDSNGRVLAMIGDQTAQVGGARVALPAGNKWFGLRAGLDATAYAIGARTERNSEMCVCRIGLDNTVDVLEPIHDLGRPDIVAGTFFVYGFGDEQIFGGTDLESNGVVAWDLEQRSWFEYRKHVDSPVDIADCYALVHVRDDTVAFYSYDGFELVFLDLSARTQRVIATPEPHGFNALTIWKNVVYFHDPYDDPNGIYRWEIGAEHMEKVGRFPGNLRGLSNGRFLATGTHGCTVVEPIAAS